MFSGTHIIVYNTHTYLLARLTLPAPLFQQVSLWQSYEGWRERTLLLLWCVVLPSTSWHLQMKTPHQTLLPYPPRQPHPPRTCPDEEARSPLPSPGWSHTPTGEGRSCANGRLLPVIYFLFYIILVIYDRRYLSGLHVEVEWRWLFVIYLG